MNKNIETQKRIVTRLRKELEPLKKEEAEARRLWTLGYNKQLRADTQLQKRIEKGIDKPDQSCYTAIVGSDR